MRLDKYLVEKTPEISRSRIQKAIKDGLVLVNEKKVLDPDYEVKETDVVTLPEFESDELKKYDLDLKVVFENNDLVVIDKPAGLVVHPGAGNKDKTLANILIAKYPNIKDVGDPHRPGIVHRLDEDTSGLIVVAKTQDAFDFLKATFQERNIEKEYLALVHGKFDALHGFIDLPIAKSPSHRKMKIGEGKEAKTEYSVIGEGSPNGVDNYTLLRVKLHTGRTHQIRVHMNAIEHPIVGDATYGKFKKQDTSVIDRQFLHAYRLKFQLMDETWIELASPLPEELKQVLTRLNIQYDDKLV
jgi:23S rRNA pseudouridine1911/1915/1917 synthase